MGRNLSAKNPIKNIAMDPPTRRYTNSDGLVVTEKLNPMQAKRRMVAPDGDVCEVSLATGYTIKMRGPGYGAGAFRGNPYGPQIMDEKFAKGWLPYDECPLANGSVPAAEGDSPCSGKFSDKECCPHLKKIIRTRRAKHSSEQQARRTNMQTTVERLLRQMEGQAERQIAATAVEMPAQHKGKGLRGG